MAVLKFISWNTCGIRDTDDFPHKKTMILRTLQNASVAFLQETHIGVNNTDDIKIFDNWKTYYSVHHPRSKGVAILIKNDLPFEYINHDVEPTGSYIVLICKLYGKCFTLVNVYNHADERKVLRALSEYLCQTAKGVLIVGGDFNTVLNPDLDREYPTNSKALRTLLEEFISSLKLVDVWAYKKPHDRESYTRSPHTPKKMSSPKTPVKMSSPQTPEKTSSPQTSEKTSPPQTSVKTSSPQTPEKTSSPQTPKKMSSSRIDMVFMPLNALWLVDNCEIKHSSISDHHPIILYLGFPKPDQTAPSTDTMTAAQAKAGEICEAEVLKAISSLIECENTNGETLEDIKVNRVEKAKELKQRFNHMIMSETIPAGFTDTVEENGWHFYKAEYMILATILVRRMEAFLQTSFKTPPKKKKNSPEKNAEKQIVNKNIGVVGFETTPNMIGMDFLKTVLSSLKGIRPSPPRDFRIVEKLLAKNDNNLDLRAGCPLTSTILTLSLQYLAAKIQKVLGDESVVNVCHYRKCLTIHMNYNLTTLQEKFKPFQKASGFSFSYFVYEQKRRETSSAPDLPQGDS